MDGTDCTVEEMSKALEHTIVGSGNDILDTILSRTLASNKVRVLAVSKLFFLLLLCRMFLSLKKIWIL